MSFAESVAWAEQVKDPNNGHTWTLLGNGHGGLSVGCLPCGIWMTELSLQRRCEKPYDGFEPR
jgi:hypothetical protein